MTKVQMMNFQYLLKKKWLKVMAVVAGVITVAIVLFSLFSLFIVWGLGYAKGVSEINNMITGSWVIKADVLGKPPVEEIFNADGTWQQGNAEGNGIQRKGKWQYIWDGNQIVVQETEVIVGTTHESINHEHILSIVKLEYDSIVCKEGDRLFVLKRKKPTEGHSDIEK